LALRLGPHANHQVAGYLEGVGERVIWTAMVSGDIFRQMGAEPPVESAAEAILEADKIKAFTATNPRLASGGSE
jgi:hypothetical protein